MQAHLLVGPIPTPIDASPFLSSSSFISTATAFNSLILPSLYRFHHNRNRQSHRRQLGPAVSASSAAVNGGEDHYAVLGLARTASSADIKRAYRLLALKYHPDVSKHSRSAEVFKTIRQAYEILSNEVTRAQYDRVLRLREDTGRSDSRRRYYNPEFEDEIKFYKWAEVRQRMQRERYWEQYNVSEDDDDSCSETEEEVAQGSLDQERGPFSEVLRSAFMTIFLLHIFGSRLSLALSSLMALFDRELDAGYKIGHLIAWVLGGRGGILLTLCLQFASWACGKTSSSIVTLVVVAMWVGSYLARFAPLPQGALLALLYMSIKLQVDLN